MRYLRNVSRCCDKTIACTHLCMHLFVNIHVGDLRISFNEAPRIAFEVVDFFGSEPISEGPQ